MWRTYKVELNSKQYFKDLDLAKKDMNRFARRMMAKVFQNIRKETKSTLKGSVLGKVSGNLYKSIKYKAKNDFTGSIGSSSWYASIHERGATILPKKGEYLTFKIGDEVKRVRQVVIPQRQFLWTQVDKMFSTNRAEELMDQVLQKALDEIFSTN